ncbi:MAG: hypothetical protein KAJ19_02830 [Gammaproteobacteria bacterium]|nr:hypothetical protein [Gammaproteobacteria bacterium]
MEMPKACECDMAECAYNADRLCHAIAITVSDTSRPKCDTVCICEEAQVNLNNTAGDVEWLITAIFATSILSCESFRFFSPISIFFLGPGTSRLSSRQPVTLSAPMNQRAAFIGLKTGLLNVLYYLYNGHKNANKLFCRGL